MDVTLFGITMFVRLLQPAKALLPMDITLFGMVTLVRLSQPAKAPSQMDVLLLPFGMMMVWIVLYESGKTGPTMKLDGIVRVVTAPQPLKAPSPIVLMEFEKLTLVKLLQPEKASLPIDVTVFAKLTSVISVRFLYWEAETSERMISFSSCRSGMAHRNIININSKRILSIYKDRSEDCF